MGVFNFIETFFFISLGISFVLILLLVYHFKQRLNSIENKSDSMFEIIHNMIYEIATVKQMCMHSENTPSNVYPNLNTESNIKIIDSNALNFSESLKPERDADEDADEDEDEDDDEDEDEDEDDDEDEDEDEDTKIIVSDDECIPDLANFDVKVIHLEPDFEPETAPQTELDPDSTAQDQEKDYQKMSPSELKALVIQKGLSTDPSKMKKPKLLHLLESAA